MSPGISRRHRCSWWCRSKSSWSRTSIDFGGTARGNEGKRKPGIIFNRLLSAGPRSLYGQGDARAHDIDEERLSVW